MFSEFAFCNDTNYCTVCNLTSGMLCHSTITFNIITIIPTIVLLLCVSSVGIVGNALVCVVQVKTRQRTSFGELVLHLAIYDFLSCAILIPTTLSMLTYADYIPLSVEQRAVYFVGLLSVMCSLIAMLLIAIDRYVKICKPFHPGISFKVSRYMFFLEIGVGLLYALPSLFLEDTTMYVENQCCISRDNAYVPSRWTTYNTLTIVFFLIVLVAFVWCYWHVFLTVRHRHRAIAPKTYEGNSKNSDSKKRPGAKRSRLNCPGLRVSGPFSTGTSGTEGSVHISSSILPIPQRRNARTAKILLTAGIAFFICWIPSLAIMGYRIEENFLDISALFIKYGDTVGGVMLLCEFWYMITHAINPVIYAFMETRFRNEILRIFRTCKEKVWDCAA